MADALLINRPNVVHSTFEDETVVVNLESGMYFSLRGTASDIWARIEQLRVDELIAQVAALSPDGGPAVETQVRSFLHDLTRHALVRVEQDAARAEGSSNGWGPYDTPAMEIYDDMQDLLLLDPIHDVDEMGWPDRV